MVESSKLLSSSCKAVFQKIFKKYSEPLVHQKGCHGISLLSAYIHVSFFWLPAPHVLCSSSSFSKWGNWQIRCVNSSVVQSPSNENSEYHACWKCRLHTRCISHRVPQKNSHLAWTMHDWCISHRVTCKREEWNDTKYGELMATITTVKLRRLPSLRKTLIHKPQTTEVIQWGITESLVSDYVDR